MYEGKHIHFSEVDNKPLCSYSPKLCKQRRLNGYAFCIRHVLEDKTAPFKQCEYVAKYNSQRCTNPIPKSEDRSFFFSIFQFEDLVVQVSRKNCTFLHRPQSSDRSSHPCSFKVLSGSLPSLFFKMAIFVKKKMLNTPYTNCPALHSFQAYLKAPCAANMSFHLDIVLPPIVCVNLYMIMLELQFNRTSQRGTEVIKMMKSSLHVSPCNNYVAHYLSLCGRPIEWSWLVNSVKWAAVCLLPLPHAVVLKISFKKQALLNTGSRRLAEASVRCTHSVKLRKTGNDDSVANKAAHVELILFNVSLEFFKDFQCVATIPLLQLTLSSRRLEVTDYEHLPTGLDWSEDSAEDDEEVERLLPYQYAWRLRERYSQDNHTPSDDIGASRNNRLARLCTYLQQKYKHLCRLERAATRQKRCRYAFQKALLHAASKDPDCAGQLIQELRMATHTQNSVRPPERGDADAGICTGNTKGQPCTSGALPFTRHCFQHILLNRSQQLFSSCTAKFADGQQCSIPVFDITHQTPLCEEHAKKMDNFLRGDGNRRVQHQQPRKPRKKTKPPALTKKHKKKRRRGPRRPQKPIPPAVPQGNLGMPSSLALPAQASSIRSPSTPDLSTDELPDDITNDITDIPNDLELNQEDFSDVLPRLPDDLQDFDLFEGKNGELLPTTEEAEELERALQAMTSYTASLECLSSMGELTQPDTVVVQDLADHRAMGVFSASSVPGAGIASLGRAVANSELGDLLNGRIPPENFSSLELDENLLHSAGGQFPAPPSSQPPHPPSATSVGLTSAAPPPSSNPLLTQSPLTERTFPPPFPGLHEGGHPSPRTHAPHLLAKPEELLPPRQQYAGEHSHSSPHGSHYSSEHVPSPYSDHITSPHPGTYPSGDGGSGGSALAASFQAEAPLLPTPILQSQLEVPMSVVPGNPRPSWNNMPLPLADPSQFGNLIGPEGHLISTSLSTPPSTSHSVTLQPSAALSALPQTNFAGLAAAHDLLTSNPPKQQLPQFSAAFGHQLASHSGIPKDVQPSHSSTAPPTGFSVAGASTASASSVTSPFPTQ
uniref:INO80 complex subunit Da n=1 Tax=Lepisosteus oculatus TaxID=7918 RepID=W5MY44_LEPOC